MELTLKERLQQLSEDFSMNEIFEIINDVIELDLLLPEEVEDYIEENKEDFKFAKDIYVARVKSVRILTWVGLQSAIEWVDDNFE